MSDRKGLSRRDFLKTAGVAGTGSLLAAAGPFMPNDSFAAENNPQNDRVPTRPFGKTGVNVSILGLGGMFDIPSNQLVLRQALKWGVTYWDTADCYEGGNSEIGIGDFFKRYPEQRKEIFLVTKSDARDPAGMTRLLDRSLDRMKTDYIDLYLIHGMKAIDEVNAATRAWMEKAKSSGKIKFFGFSTHSNMEELMLAAAKLGWIDGIMMTYNYRVMAKSRMQSAVTACTEAGIGLTAMKTQGSGWFSGLAESGGEMTDRFIKLGFSDKQANLKAVWENPNIACVCSQMPNMSILTSNIAAALNQTRLSAADLLTMQRYAHATSSTYCAGCTRLCEPTVAGQAPIGDIMRYLMYHNSYGERDRARSLFAGLPAVTRDCLLGHDYSEAEKVCPQGLKIGQLMREATRLLG
ncbi:aldo/keto reductase [Desulfoferrobacter suflitae]|uniref:aldo/keto reductase n=1 Tax=Desulfoferrobacter suflitae TaxID=2865782 RepID=UPI00216409CE|nr:aldo/keto reductase [Desulfoferrobacter suflitae]MCK8600843.1 aldo/keto reductase [Desulfoferrobacter suflitae]